EFSSRYRIAANGDVVTANTWLLTKIIDVDGNVIDFEYQKRFLTCMLSFGQKDFSGSCQSVFGGQFYTSGSAFFNGTIEPRIRAGTLQWPRYLSKISWKNGNLNF